MIQKMAKRFRAMPKVMMAAGGYLDNDPLDGSSSVTVGGVRKKKFDGTPIPYTGQFAGTPLNLTPKDKFIGKVPSTSNGINLSGIAPYASNIINSFRRSPKPVYPTMNSAPVLSKINMDDARNQVGREISSSNTGADRTLDSNTASAVKLFNSGRKLNALSGINEYEKNANSSIANQQAQIDWYTQTGNNAKIDNYNNEITSSKIADQNNQSANLANAADKFVAIGNEKQKANVERDKTKTLSTMFSTTGPAGGVFNRERLRIAKSGAPDPILGRPLTDLEAAQMEYSNSDNTTPSVSSMKPVSQQPTTVNNAPVIPNGDRVPYTPKQAAGYPYSNTQLPSIFTKPNNILGKTKFKMGGNMSRMKKVNY